jgi:RNA polymerase sigma factor (sigma-70 family)
VRYHRLLAMTKTEEFSELLRTYGDMAYRMSLHLTGGREQEARDLVQDGFIRIWRYWSFQKPDHFKSWMYRILHNLYLDSRRRATRRPTVSLDDVSPYGEDLSWEDRFAEAQPQPAGILETKELQQQVGNALRRLPDEFRIPVMLCDMEGLSYDEIAKVVSCPVGTVRSRIHRATLGHLKEVRHHDL